MRGRASLPLLVAAALSASVCGGPSVQLYNQRDVSAVEVTPSDSTHVRIRYSPLLETTYFSPGANAVEANDSVAVELVRGPIKEKCRVSHQASRESGSRSSSRSRTGGSRCTRAERVAADLSLDPGPPPSVVSARGEERRTVADLGISRSAARLSAARSQCVAGSRGDVEPGVMLAVSPALPCHRADAGLSAAEPMSTEALPPSVPVGFVAPPSRPVGPRVARAAATAATAGGATTGEATAGEATAGELLKRLSRGEVAALDAALGQYWAPLVGYLVGVLGSRDAAEDIAQETFWRLWQRRDRLRADGSLRGFLYQVAHNLAMSEQRRARTRTRALGVMQTEQPAAALVTDVTADEPLDAALDRAIRGLPTRRREVLLLRSVHGLSYKEIARTLGIAPQTVANQFSAALATLRETLRHLLP